MKPSLEEERRALLEQIEASRAQYRRLLHDEEKPVPSWMARRMPGFPRSRTMRWIVGHPWLAAAGVGLLAWLGPVRMASKARARAPGAVRHAAGRAAAVGALLLRDPGRLRMAGKLARMALRFLQRRRAQRTPGG